jgi:hypothetical protein
MNNVVGVLIAVGIGAIVVLGLFAFEDDEPTQEEANEQFCDDVGEFTAAVAELRDVDRDTPIEEFEETRDIVRERYDAMIESARGLTDVRLDDLEEANNALRAAVDDIDDDASLQEALDSIEDEADEVATQIGQLLVGVEGCGSGQGGQELSDE